MKRVRVPLRDRSDSRAAETGVVGLTVDVDGTRHKKWDESTAYLLTPTDSDLIIRSAYEAVSMARDAVDFLLDGQWGTLGYSVPLFEMMRESFDRRQKDFISRYDFVWKNDGSLVLYDIDGDSPRGIVETAHTQRHWVFDSFGQKAKKGKITQLNSIPESIEDVLRQAASQVSRRRFFSVAGDDFDSRLTAAFIRDIAVGAGWDATSMRWSDFCWDGRQWVGRNGERVSSFYKHVPWDTVVMSRRIEEDLSEHYLDLTTPFDPLWKAVLSSRAVIPAMSFIYPGSNLIPNAKNDDSYGISSDMLYAPYRVASSMNEVGILSGRAFTSWGESLKDFGKQSLAYRDLSVPRRFRDDSGGYRFLYVSVYTVGGLPAGVMMNETRLPMLGSYRTFKPHLVVL